MTFLQLAAKRYSSRKYKSTPIDKETILKVIEAARIAPSAANCQPWSFVVASSQETLSNLRMAYPQEWFKQAPVVIVVCGDHARSWKRKDGKDHCDIDISIAVDHMTLQATELGLGTCWICNFDPIACHEMLNLPPHVEPIAMLSLGYSADSSDSNRHAKARKTISELVHWEKYE